MENEDQHSLKSGTIVDKYKIIRILGEGGFGITYLAEDIHLGLKVVIKEYFPNEFAMRTHENTITAKSKSIEVFKKGKQRFKEEAQILAKFNHPSIVKILGYFEANDTAYFVMEYEEGMDLSQYLKQQNRALSQEEILSIIMPILEGLKEVHKFNYLHRDIKPGNILLRANKSPVLIDFGATRVAVNDDKNKSVTSTLTEGYAPFEQYSTDLKRQGPFSDIYAVGAVMYKMITMKTPIASQTRSFQILQDGNDLLEKLSKMNLKAYDQSFLEAIDKTLESKPTDRQQSVEELQQSLIFRLDVKQQEPEKKEKKIKVNEPLGLGGGLFFVGIYLILSFLSYLAYPFGLSEHSIVEYTPFVLNLKSAVLSFFTVLSAYLLYLYFRKKDNFVKTYIYVLIASNIYFFIEYGNYVSVEVVGFLAWGVILNVLIIIYLLPSERVKNTFINPKDSNYVFLVIGVVALLMTVPFNKVLEYIIVEKSDPVYLQDSCNTGDFGNCVRLGNLYYNGQNVSVDFMKAAQAYELACNGGLMPACSGLGNMYYEGEGVKKDIQKANALLEKACKFGESIGCYNLGYLYETGAGEKQDLIRAKESYQKACKGGYELGCTNYKKLK